MPFAATWMQPEITILSEVSQKETPYNIIKHGIQHMTQMNLPMKQKQNHGHRQQHGGYQEEGA